MTRILLTTSALLLAGVTAFAAPAASKHAAKKPAQAAKVAKLVCPVTGETIASVKDAQGSSTYQGKTYYFCCPSCKPAFDKNPAKYLKAASADSKTKPVAAHRM